jgi:outer membrane murein-binding lipoprotein Lpp
VRPVADTLLLVSALIAIAFANAAVWWKWGREVKALNDHLTTQVARLVREQIAVTGEREAARRAWQAAETENESLRARNDMLSGLVGGDR